MPQPIVGVRLSNGLGNQMYQYAAGLALAARLGAELRCDTSAFRKGKSRREGLRQFGLDWAEATAPSAMGLRRLGLPLPGPCVLEDTGPVEPHFFTVNAPVYLSGYFQSFRYFAGHEAGVRDAFDVSKIGGERTGAIEAAMQAAENPVALHVRRTDYVKSAAAIARNAPVGIGYYDRARTALEARIGKPTYFLFSDDVPLALSELAGWPDIVPVSGFSTHEDFRLMASCRHFIIANSTFSWWAGWLGNAADKLVISPDRWFGPASKWPDIMADRIPADWLQVPSG